MDNLKKEIGKIELPEAAKQRILQNCRTKIESEQENYSMKKKLFTNFKKPLIAAAALAVVLSLTGITAMATTGTGFFKNEKRFDGAITGQTYHNATDEILVYAAVEEDVLTVALEMVKYEVAPYSEIEMLKLEKYRVLDAAGAVVLEDAKWETVILADNQAFFEIPADMLAEGTYKLQLDVICGSKKADADLLIYGNWECEFTK